MGILRFTLIPKKWSYFSKKPSRFLQYRNVWFSSLLKRRRSCRRNMRSALPFATLESWWAELTLFVNWNLYLRVIKELFIVLSVEDYKLLTIFRRTNGQNTTFLLRIPLKLKPGLQSDGFPRSTMTLVLMIEFAYFMTLLGIFALCVLLL